MYSVRRRGLLVPMGGLWTGQSQAAVSLEEEAAVGGFAHTPVSVCKYTEEALLM